MDDVTKVALLMLGVAVPIACGKQGESEPASSVASLPADETAPAAQAQPPESDALQPASGERSAAEQIAEARCHREKTCGHVGTNRDYDSLADCQDKVRSDWSADLSTLACPGGIRVSQLDECLTQIDGQSCNSPFDALSRIAACTQGQICVEQR